MAYVPADQGAMLNKNLVPAVSMGSAISTINEADSSPAQAECPRDHHAHHHPRPLRHLPEMWP
jgi:hypothetical protein